jgi:hypothetical protein
MTAKPGDRIQIETERVGMKVREGTVLEATETPFGTNYRVRWDDGRETEFRPAAGSAQIIPAEPEAEPAGRLR